MRTLALLATLYMLLYSPLAEARNLPPPPKNHIFDEPRALSTPMRQALNSLLEEQEESGGGYIVLAIFQSLEKEDLSGWTQTLLRDWKLAESKSNRRVLLALYWEEKEAFLAAGTELEPILNQEVSHQIISKFLLPEIYAQHPDRAFSLATLEILKTLESALIQSGRAPQLIQQGGFKGEWEPVPGKLQTYGWVFILFLGLLLSGSVLYLLVSAEAHFTSQGWFRPKLTSYFELKFNRKSASSYGGTSGTWS